MAHQRSADALPLVFVDNGKSDFGRSRSHRDVASAADDYGSAPFFYCRDQGDMIYEIDVQKELDTHQTFESWGREGQELARSVVYLNGDLKVAASSARRIAADADVPTAPEGYAQNCGRVARVQVGKAALRLADQVKRLLP